MQQLAIEAVVWALKLPGVSAERVMDTKRDRTVAIRVAARNDAGEFKVDVPVIAGRVSIPDMRDAIRLVAGSKTAWKYGAKS